MAHESFRNPPIIEAVAAVRFLDDGHWTDEAHAKVKSGIAEVYGGETRQELQVHVHARLDEGAGSATTTSTPHRVLMHAVDGSGLVGLVPGVVSVHVLKPYPGWREFRRRIEEVAQIISRVLPAPRVIEVAIRYVDRIALPTGSVPDLSAYFTAIPRRPGSMPTALSGFQSIVESRDPESGVVAVLTSSSVPPAHGESFVMMYDLNLVQPFAPEAALPIESALPALEGLHDRQYQIFMDSITERAKELFQ